MPLLHIYIFWSLPKSLVLDWQGILSVEACTVIVKFNPICVAWGRGEYDDVKKSCIRETLNLLTDADKSTDTIFLGGAVKKIIFYGGGPKKFFLGDEFIFF